MDKTWTKTISLNLAVEIQPYPQLFFPTHNISRIYTYKYRAFSLSLSPHAETHTIHIFMNKYTYKYVYWFNANLKGHLCDRHGNESWALLLRCSSLVYRRKKLQTAPAWKQAIVKDCWSTKVSLVRYQCYRNVYRSTKVFQLKDYAHPGFFSFSTRLLICSQHLWEYQAISAAFATLFFLNYKLSGLLPLTNALCCWHSRTA